MKAKGGVEDLDPSLQRLRAAQARGLVIMGCQYRKWETDYYGMCVGGGRSVRCCNVVGGKFLTIMGYQTRGG